MKLLKIGFFLSLVIFFYGCQEQGPIKNKVKQTNQTQTFGQEINHDFIKLKTDCSGQSATSQWLDQNSLKIKLPVILESRGSKLKETKTFVKNQTIEVFILEEFCQENCPQTSNTQCVEIYLDDIKKDSYNVNIHRMEQISQGGIINKFKINES
ncbi:MAG: hypothetical protein GF335_01585 [Candidatus Moranbacteria bacterium]|nr:hypothetical protein [Candidatus Moranbacteria bacterium]